MTATLNNHKEVSGFLKCSMAHMGGARPVVLKEHVKIEDTVSLSVLKKVTGPYSDKFFVTFM